MVAGGLLPNAWIFGPNARYFPSTSYRFLCSLLPLLLFPLRFYVDFELGFFTVLGNLYDCDAVVVVVVEDKVVPPRFY